jgi:hypothetical protein
MPMPFSDVIRLSDPQRAQLEALEGVWKLEWPGQVC